MKCRATVHWRTVLAMRCARTTRPVYAREGLNGPGNKPWRSGSNVINDTDHD